jgi:hypothetical protein
MPRDTSSVSMRISWFFVATCSDRAIDPVLMKATSVPRRDPHKRVPRFSRPGERSRSVSRLVRYPNGFWRLRDNANLIQLDEAAVSDRSFAPPESRAMSSSEAPMSR